MWSDSLKLKLYQKVWYMQSYRETFSVSQLNPLPGTSQSRRTDKSRVGGTRDGGDEDEDQVEKWRQRYEGMMNPKFESFRGRVRGFHVQMYTLA